MMNSLPVLPDPTATLCILRGSVCLHLAQIVRLQADRNYTYIVLADGTSYLTSASLSYYSRLLPTFWRVHKSHLLNAEHITARTRTHLCLSDGSSVEVSRRKRAIVKKIID
jgi:two-component system, LytTR family, response regulator